MTGRRIRYVGPAPVALATATMLADADGIDLTSSEPPVASDDVPGSVVLVVTIEGTPEAVDAAVGRARGGLPAGATITVE